MVVQSINELLDFVYPGLKSSNTLPPPDFFHDRAILAARNGDVNRINHNVLRMLGGTETILFSADKVVTESGADASTAQYPVELLRSLDAPGLPPGKLHIKIGCPLILLVNLSPSCGLCNGTRMVLRQASHHVLEVSILGGSHNGSIALIPQVSLTPNSDGSDFPFVLRRCQFPVRLAFAMSINKSQGQSLKFVGLDLRVPVFTHGQLYVALSRATSGDRIRALLPQDSEGETQNCFFSGTLRLITLFQINSQNGSYSHRFQANICYSHWWLCRSGEPQHESHFRSCHVRVRPQANICVLDVVLPVLFSSVSCLLRRHMHRILQNMG